MNRSPKARLLGDANFPRFALQYYRDGRQLLVQDLFERYSSLAFTKPTDRAVALLGLQNRMAAAFGTRAAYGLFSAYFPRGLLWRRGDGDSRMTPITWPPGHPVPSWSWLSKAGPIKYPELEFAKIEWASGNFVNPLRRREEERHENVVVLRGKATSLSLEEDERGRITFDTRDDYDLDQLCCVVIGRDKLNSSGAEPNAYAPIIHPKSGSDNQEYERVGVASVKTFHIGDGREFWVNIV